MSKFIAAPKDVISSMGIDVIKKDGKYYFKKTGELVDTKKYIIYKEDDMDLYIVHTEEKTQKEPGSQE